MRWFFTLVGILVASPLAGVIVGAWLSGIVAQQTTDLQHRPVFLSESLALVLEFATFYDQQSHDFKAVTDNFEQLSPPQWKAFMEESLAKLSLAEKQANLLEFKATRYFHGTDWLAKFEEIHKIWHSAADTESIVYKQQLSGESIDWNWPSSLSRAGDQVSEKTAQLLNQFTLLMKSLPPESSVLGSSSSPTPTPNPNDIN
jgi:hypothetical protein